MLGMDVAVLDEAGKAVTDKPGELVCRNAHVSMPLGFWNDSDGSRYHEAYFGGFDKVWTHGDFAEQLSGGGFIIHGRSDTTLNPGGVRIGTAEIYRQLENIDSIEEAIAVGQDVAGDQKVILFVKLREGSTLSEELEKEIRRCIRSGASPRHVPAHIIAVTAIPRTQSGKISESAVREAMHGRAVSNSHALANPEALEQYRQLFREQPTLE
jgi:acetoacetyl-CoA synthetase